MERLTTTIVCNRQAVMWPNFGFLAWSCHIHPGRFTRNYALACFDRAENPQRTVRADDPVRCWYCRGYKPDARPTAAVGRRLYLCAVSARRKPAADRSRYDVADHGWAVDPGPSRGARDRYLFLHHARPALDLDPVAGASVVCKGLCGGRLERAGGACGICDRRDVRVADKISLQAAEREHDAGIRRGGAGVDRAASVGAAACAGVADHGGVGRRTDRGGRPARRAVIRVAAIDGAVGQSAWWFCVRSGADRADRARCRLERGSEAAEIAGAAMGGIRCGGAGAKLRHALWLEFAAGVTENPWPRRRAAADHGMEACGFRQRRCI